MFGMCVLELRSLYPCTTKYILPSVQWTNPPQVENCKGINVWKFTLMDAKWARTEVLAQNNRTKMELQLETEQQIHFRSVLKLFELHARNPVEDSDDVEQHRLSPSPRRPNTLQRCCVCGRGCFPASF